MTVIKSFIYLDNDKMFSLSSQIFEGVTEYVLNEESIGRDDTGSHTKKELGGSSKVIADVMRESKVSSEKKYLHDYSMTLFEEEMSKKGKVLTIDSDYDLDNLAGDLDKFSFVKVKSKVKFIDFGELCDFLNSHKEISFDISNVTQRERIEYLKNEFEQLKKKPKKNPEEKALIAKINKDGVAGFVADEMWGNLSKEYNSALSRIIEFGFYRQLMLVQDVSNVKFATILNHECLRDSYKMILSKFARKTSKEIVVFGMVSQGLGVEQDNAVIGDMDLTNMRTAIDTFSEYMSVIDLSISGKAESEVVIDPIAIYFEL